MLPPVKWQAHVVPYLPVCPSAQMTSHEGAESGAEPGATAAIFEFVLLECIIYFGFQSIVIDSFMNG